MTRAALARTGDRGAGRANFASSCARHVELFAAGSSSLATALRRARGVHHSPRCSGQSATTHPVAQASALRKRSAYRQLCLCSSPTYRRVSTRGYATGVVTAGARAADRDPLPDPLRAAPGAGRDAWARTPPTGRSGRSPSSCSPHGYDVTPDTYANLLDSWVRSGLVVAAPVFPDTNAAAVAADGNLTAPESDDVNQPGDHGARGAARSWPRRRRPRSRVLRRRFSTASSMPLGSRSPASPTGHRPSPPSPTPRHTRHRPRTSRRWRCCRAARSPPRRANPAATTRPRRRASRVLVVQVRDR